MKLLFYSDVHWSPYSSILRSRGEKYSTRLEGLIKSMNWVMDLAKQKDCKFTFCLGDFFDLSGVDAESITALNEIKWTNVPHYFICGNHEMGLNNHEYSSMKLFNLLPNARVIDESFCLDFDDKCEICFLPYVLESNRKPITEYFGEKPKDKKRLILSHNDIAGIQMGSFLSKVGFSIEELEANADKVINGHIHNGGKITNKIINIGSLSANNFTNDSFIYTYGAFIFDTDTFTIDVFENPYAFNFYKVNTLETSFNIEKIKPNAIISLSCKDNQANDYRKLLANSQSIIESKVTVKFDVLDLNIDSSVDIKELAVNAEDEFKKHIHATLGTSDIIEEELNEVFK